MADKNDTWKENVPGKIYVDRTCISCDTCCITAPINFEMHVSEEGHAFIAKQPSTPEEELACKEAIEACPVGAIGDDNE